MRKSLGDYTKDFSWLEIRQKGAACEYRCDTCSVRGAKNKFSEWRVQKVGFQRFDLADHQKAADNNPACTATQQAETKLEECKASVLPLFRLTMVLGSEEVSMRKSEPFLTWGERNGVACTSSWRSKNYNWPFATATADVQRQVLEGPCAGSEVRHNYGDCAVAKQLVFYVKVQGAVLFAGMLDMAADGSGEAIKNACIQLLTDLDMEHKNLTAVATDGAVAMEAVRRALPNSCQTGPRELSSRATVFCTESISQLLTCLTESPTALMSFKSWPWRSRRRSDTHTPSSTGPLRTARSFR